MADSVKTTRICILSHGRSGTLYMACVLNAAGIRVGHEQDGPDGCVGAVFWKGHRNLDDYDVVLHQVRHPLSVIASSTTSKKSSFVRLYRELGITTYISDNPVQRGMRSWLDYTNWADRYAQYTYRVEDLPNMWDDIMLSIGRQCPLPSVSTSTNHREHTELTWADLDAVDEDLAARIEEKSILYGYNVCDWNNNKGE